MTEFRKKVEEEQKWGKDKLKFDPDSSPKAFGHYSKNYSFEITEKKLYKVKDRSRLKGCVDIEKNNYLIAGDCSFNFNEKKKEIFEGIINNDPDVDTQEKSRVKNKLKECSDNHHTLINFDLIPVSGGMNNTKGSLKYKDGKVMVHGVGKKPKLLLDRLDTFIYFLDYSLKKRKDFISAENVALKSIGEFFSNSVFTKSMHTENFEDIYELLGKYEDIYEYCRVFYCIKDKEFIDKLIESGKKPIKTTKDVENYIDLAIKFWEKKEVYFLSLQR